METTTLSVCEREREKIEEKGSELREGERQKRERERERELTRRGSIRTFVFLLPVMLKRSTRTTDPLVMGYNNKFY